MKILKKCLTCGTDFVATKMSSKYCCRKCERVAQRKREAEKRENARENASADIPSELETKQFLTPKDIAKLLNVGLTTVYRYFYSGMLKAVRVRRHTLVRRSDLEKFFDEAVPYKKTSYKKKADNEYYTLKEIMEKYNLGRKAVWNRCEKLGIPKVYEGRNTFWSKKAIDSKFADLIEEVNLDNYYTIIESFLDEKTSKFQELINKYKSFSEEQKLLINRNRELLISCRGIKIEKILSDWKEKKLTHIVSGHIVTYPQEPYIVPFIIKEENEGLLDFNNIKIVEEKPLPRASVEEKQKESDFNHSDFLGSSESNNLYITLSEGKIWFHNKQTNEEISLFDDIFDTSSYNSAYFTSDGKNVVFVGKDKSMGFIGFEEMIKKPFEVEGSTIARYAGYNGYKPEILFDESNGRKPVWRDPITLKKISEAEMSNHAFLSPDGKYVAEMQKKTVYFNRITKEELSAEEYLNLRKKYEWTSNSTEEEKKKKAELRKLLLDNCGKEELFHYVIEHNEKLIHSAQDGKMSEKQIAHRIDELNKRDEEEYLNSKSEFVHLFIDILGYVCYKEVGSDVQNRILIGRSVWFLNYVSFSYDSRYLAFGAKMKEDTWRFSEEGVFEIYDLKEKKIVDRKDKESDLHAVWMTMFSQNGDVAYYDSHANAMVAYSESDYRYTNIAKGKSLLCFSPSGRYIALSDQNYISYLHHSNENWGHQPSGNIYIHETVDLENCLEQYNDFGDGIDGTTRTTRRAGNVASAAFSSDEKRLLAVGEDGVIVIRNLALSYWEDIIDDYVISGGNDEKQYYRKRERNGIVTISCNTPDGLENKVVDFWAETDETLDSEQGLIYSEDYSELKKSLNIYNKEYKLPDGVKTIKQKAFSGRWGYEGDYNSLETLYLPDSIETIEETFEECPSLKYIYVSKNSEEKIKNLLPHLIDVIIPL